MQPDTSPPRALLARLRSPSGLALVAAVVMVAIYFALRSPSPQETSRILVTTWALAASALAVISPRAGLVVLIAIGPFAEIALFNEFLRAKTIIAAFLLAGVVVRLIYALQVRRRQRRDPAGRDPARRGTVGTSVPSADAADPTASGPTPSGATASRRGGPVVEGATASRRWGPGVERIFDRLSPLTHPALVLGLAALLVVGTGLSLWLVSLSLGEPFASRAATAWGGGIWTPFAAMFAAVWLGWRGDRTILVVTAVIGVISAIVGLLALRQPDLFTGTPVYWVVERAAAARRLVGVIDVPNAAATIFLAPAVLLLSAAVFVRDIRVRIAAGAAGLVTLAALYLTLSRSALVAVALVVAIVAWRYSRRVGLVVVAGGIVAVAVLLPRYLAQRTDAAGGGTGGLATVGDSSRISAWEAAVRMWLDQPVTGHGFRTYQLLHERYGEAVISAPHNEWLRFFAEEGTVIGLAGLGFVALGALTLARPRGWLASGILGTFVAYALMASVNNPLTYVQVGLMVFPVVGIGLGRAWADRSSADRSSADGVAAAAAPAVGSPAAAPVGSPADRLVEGPEGQRLPAHAPDEEPLPRSPTDEEQGPG